MKNNAISLSLILCIPLFLLSSSGIWSQENNIKENLDWDNERFSWASSWVTHPDASRSEYGVFNLRNRFMLESVPESLLVYVSADNRYRLMINGMEVSSGPAKGSLMHWRYETLNIAPYLIKGENILAAEIFNLGEHRPAAQFSHQTAFIFQTEGWLEDQLNTPGDWLIHHNRAYKPIAVTKELVKGYYVAGPTDLIEGAHYPWGWEVPDYDDSKWLTTVVVTKGVGRGYMHGVPWMLVPRNIPQMEQRTENISLIRRCEGIQADPQFTSGKHPLVVPPNTICTILLDQEYLTTTFPRISLSGGKEAKLKISYAEALYHKDLWKGNRNEIEDKKMIGYYDLILPEGGSNRVYQTLNTRTYRYLQLDISTGKEALTINHLSGIYTAYPFKRNASFSAEDPFLDEVQKIGWRTARLCAMETYMDCPYYEQLQYLGDTRIQALISLYVSGDDRLMRNTLQQADNSRLPEGLTLSRAPSAIPQIIPPFSLYWVDMVHDYHMHRSDNEFVQTFLPGIQAVLGWFERKMRTDGLLGGLEWLNFTDWTDGFKVGSPPGVDQGGSALISLNFAYALDKAAELFEYFGERIIAQRYATLSRHIKKSVFELCFNQKQGLLADTPAQEEYSQHSNIFAILTDCIPPELQKKAMRQVLNDSSLVQSTIYYRFYLFEAMLHTGFGDAYLDMLSPWQEMIDKGLTTWEEGDYEERSDCHAWGSSPNYHLLSIVSGIRPAAPGFSKVRIEPHLGKLEKVTASMPHPGGIILIEYHHKPGKKLEAAIELPEGLEGEISWGGKRLPLKAGKQLVKLKIKAEN